MSSKITPDHLSRIAVVYVRQSTLAQVTKHLESQHRYILASLFFSRGYLALPNISQAWL